MVVLRVLSKSQSCEYVYDRARMVEETAGKYANDFMTTISDTYGPMYLNRSPTVQKIGNLDARYNAAGFPGFVGAVYFCLISWNNFLLAQNGQYYSS